jgi:DNA-binding GntR family transcriptional regulator
MFQAMAELEAICAGLCARAMGARARKALASRHAAMGRLAAAGRIDAYRAANVAFHEALYAGCGNAYLAEFADATRRRLAPGGGGPPGGGGGGVRAAQLGGAERLAGSHAEHGAIVAAILAGDAAGAAAATRAHLAATEGAWGVMAGQPQARSG